MQKNVDNVVRAVYAAHWMATFFSPFHFKQVKVSTGRVFYAVFLEGYMCVS